MNQEEININIKEIITKLARLQDDINYLKSQISKEDNRLLSLEEEMDAWEKMSEKDTSNWEKENLENG